MKERIKNRALRIKNHVSDNRAAYLLALLSAALLQGNYRNSKKFDAFLIGEGIDPLKFWIPEFYEELES